MLDGLARATVLVADLAVATAHARELLGRDPDWSGLELEGGAECAGFRLANAALELVAPAPTGAVAEVLRERLDSRGEGMLALVFSTRDAAACAAALRRRGVDVSDPFDERLRDGTPRERRSVLVSARASRGLLILAAEVGDDAPSAAAPPAASVAALDHAVVASSDLDAARSFYGDGLGLRLALDRTFPTRRTRILFFRMGGVTLEVAGSSAPDAAADAEDRFFGLAYRVGDVAAARVRLAAAGVEVSEVRAGRKPGTRVCTVRSATHGVPTLLIGPA